MLSIRAFNDDDVDGEDDGEDELLIRELER
jgi:hypothetical protein